MGWLISAAGLLVVVVALWDIFHTLWHPEGFGRIAQWTFRTVWWTTKRVMPERTRQLAGPIGVLGTVATWTALVVVGWALVYLPHMPEGFYFGSALKPALSSDLIASVYLSLVTVATLGFGDVIPADPLLRLLTPFEALLGFVLLTAAISWVLQVYPALGRRRSVAKRLSLLESRHSTEVVADGEVCVATRILETLTEGLIQVETDFLQYAESYYFREEDEELSLPATLPYALKLADAGGRSSSREVRHAAGVLDAAIRSLALRLDGSYLGTSSEPRTVISLYAADHGFESHA